MNNFNKVRRYVLLYPNNHQKEIRFDSKKQQSLKKVMKLTGPSTHWIGQRRIIKSIIICNDDHKKNDVEDSLLYRQMMHKNVRNLTLGKYKITKRNYLEAEFL